MKAKGTAFLLVIILTIAAQAGQRAPGVSRESAGAANRLTPPGDRAVASRVDTTQPLAFEANQGQTDPQVQFLSRGSGSTLFLTGREAVLRLRGGQPPVAKGMFQNKSDDRAETMDVVHVKLQGANPNATILGEEQLPRISNYLIGNDANKWRTNVPNYAKVRYRDIYPGVDLVFYGHERRLEFDFIVAPGADPNAIMFDVGAGLVPAPKVSGAQLARRRPHKSPLRIDADGDLVITTVAGELRFVKPVFYQSDDSPQLSVARRQLPPSAEGGEVTMDSGRQPGGNPKSKIQNRKLVDGRYVLMADNRVKFKVGRYDPSRPLWIDPAINSSFFGSSGTDVGTGVAISSGGSLYFAGWTDSTSFPTTSSAYQTASGGGKDAFIARINSCCKLSNYTTYLGGNGDDIATSIAADSSDNVYVTGRTNSSTFPMKAPIQALNAGGRDAFVTELNSYGSGLVYSTYLGGAADDSGQGIALDSGDNVYIVGTTQSSNFPVSSLTAYQATYNGGTCGTSPNTYACHDAFLTKIAAGGASVLYSTYLGGNGDDFGNGIALDASANACLTGATASSDFPATASAYQSMLDGTQNAFMAKLNPAASGAASLVYSTYLGGSGTDSGNGVAVDTSGNVYVTGGTSSTNFPTSVGALRPALNGTQDAFVTKLNPQASGAASLVYSTYLGGSGIDYANAIAINGNGNAYVTGYTTSSDFPLPSGYDGPSYQGSGDAFLTKLWVSGGGLIVSTYVGGSGMDIGNALALDTRSDQSWIVGTTTSTSLFSNGCAGFTCWGSPLYGSYQGGPSDALAAQIFVTVLPFASLSPSSLTFPDTVVGQSSVAETATLINQGDAAMSLSTLGISGDFLQTNTCPVGGDLAPNASCTVTITFSPATVGARSGLLTISDNSATGSIQTVPLSGLGTSGEVTLSTNAMTFANQVVGSTSVAQPVLLTNSATSSLIIKSIVSSSSAFVESNTCGSLLSAAATCTINVTFAPTATGPQAGSITITDSSPTSPESITLSGTGIAPTVSVGTPSGTNTLTFPDQLVATASSPQTITLTDPTGGPVVISSILVVGEGDFGVNDTCFGTVPARGSCTVNVYFIPGSPGTRTATLKITDNAAGSPQTLNLTGSGTSLPANTKAALTAGTDYSTGANPQGIVGGDFNGDGILDLAVAANGSNSVSLLLGKGDGTFQTAQSFALPAGSSGPVALVAGDFNHDGKLDLAVVNQSTNNLSIFLNNGSTVTPFIVRAGTDGGGPELKVSGGSGAVSMQAASTSPTGNTPVSLAMGDFNQDGILDLAVTNSADQTVGVLLGKGDGSFQPQATYGTGAGPAGVVTADFNGDKILDLAIADAGSNQVSVLLGKGDGTFGSRTDFATGNGPTPLAVADFNQDGILDLAVGSTADNTVSILLGNGSGGVGNGTFASHVDYSTGGIPPTDLRVCDFSRDGRYDIAVVGGNKLSVLLGTGAGTFISPIIYPSSGALLGVACGDFKDEGTNSAVASNSDSSAVSVFLNTPLAFSTFSMPFGSVQVGTSASLIESLTNVGAASITFSNIAFSGSNAGDFSQTNTCGALPTTLGVGASCLIMVTFAPTATGSRSATLSITDTAVGSPQKVSLTGTGAPAGTPAVTLSPSSIAFGNQSVGTTSSAQSVTVNNTGNGSLSISSMSITGTNASDFAVASGTTCSTSTAVTAGGACTLKVTFTPGASGSRSATLSIADNAMGSPQTVALTGTGIAVNTPAGTNVSVAPADAVTGTSPVTLTFSSVTSGGTTNLTTGGTCPAAPAGYGPGSPAICYTLSTTAAYTGTITIAINFTGVTFANPGAVRLFHYESSAWADRTVSVSTTTHTVTGAVSTLSPFAVLEPPAVSLSPSSLGFNNQGMTTTSSSQAITVTDNGTAALTFAGISITGINASDFALASGTTCSTSSGVGAGASCTIKVAFTPAATGPRTGTLTLQDDATGSPQTISLSGNGVVAYSLGATSTTASVVRSTDSTTFTISAATTYGFTGSIALACTGNGSATCAFSPASIAPGQTSTLTVSGLNSLSGNTLNFSVMGTGGTQTASLALTVTIADFAIGAASGSSTSATVSAGNSASYTLSLSPAGGFNQTVSLACAWQGTQPRGTNCSLSPNSVTLNGSTASTVTVNVSTTARSLAWRRPVGPRLPLQPPRLPVGLPWAVALLALALLALVSRRKRRMQWALTATLVAMLAWAACGGGSGGGTPPPPPPTGTPAGTYGLTVTATYSGTSPPLSHNLALSLTVN